MFAHWKWHSHCRNARGKRLDTKYELSLLSLLSPLSLLSLLSPLFPSLLHLLPSFSFLLLAFSLLPPLFPSLFSLSSFLPSFLPSGTILVDVVFLVIFVVDVVARLVTLDYFYRKWNWYVVIRVLYHCYCCVYYKDKHTLLLSLLSLSSFTYRYDLTLVLVSLLGKIVVELIIPFSSTGTAETTVVKVACAFRLLRLFRIVSVVKQ